MPIYEYKCNKCGVFEVMQRITEPPLKKCPTCKGKAERIVSRTSFVLKGSGWYATDYGKKGDSESTKPAETASDANGKTTAPENPVPKPVPESKPATSKPKSSKSSAPKSSD
ncbi:MAG TPA: zinc ribbon domain-containing protein [Candidatus Binataceae bacterium]|nr:zinc ribbon domain-containing protein [Candidatus Binataceae bacterium]